MEEQDDLKKIIDRILGSMEKLSEASDQGFKDVFMAVQILSARIAVLEEQAREQENQKL